MSQSAGHNEISFPRPNTDTPMVLDEAPPRKDLVQQENQDPNIYKHRVNDDYKLLNTCRCQVPS